MTNKESTTEYGERLPYYQINNERKCALCGEILISGEELICEACDEIDDE